MRLECVDVSSYVCSFLVISIWKFFAWDLADIHADEVGEEEPSTAVAVAGTTSSNVWVTVDDNEKAFQIERPWMADSNCCYYYYIVESQPSQYPETRTPNWWSGWLPCALTLAGTRGAKEARKWIESMAGEGKRSEQTYLWKHVDRLQKNMMERRTERSEKKVYSKNGNVRCLQTFLANYMRAMLMD